MSSTNHLPTGYLTTLEAAQYLNCSPQYLNIARCRRKGPPYCKLGRAVRYRRAALDEWMLRGEAQISNVAKEAVNV
jgi:excisionase family DNA binding protein